MPGANVRIMPGRDQEELRKLEKAIEENALSADRLTRAIEQGGPVENIVKWIRELESVLGTLESRKKETMGRQARLGEVGDIAKTIREYVTSWWLEFDGMPDEFKRWMIWKIVTGVTVDKKGREVNFGLRTIPAVIDTVREVYENQEKTKTASEHQMPFRRTLVAGIRYIVYRKTVLSDGSSKRR